MFGDYEREKEKSFLEEYDARLVSSHYCLLIFVYFFIHVLISFFHPPSYPLFIIFLMYLFLTILLHIFYRSFYCSSFVILLIIIFLSAYHTHIQTMKLIKMNKYCPICKSTNKTTTKKKQNYY